MAASEPLWGLDGTRPGGSLDPETNSVHCPAVFLDEETGDLIFQGWTVTDPGTLAESSQHSPIADTESLVRFPARMRAVMEALHGEGAS